MQWGIARAAQGLFLVAVLFDGISLLQGARIDMLRCGLKKQHVRRHTPGGNEGTRTKRMAQLLYEPRGGMWQAAHQRRVNQGGLATHLLSPPKHHLSHASNLKRPPKLARKVKSTLFVVVEISVLFNTTNRNLETFFLWRPPQKHTDAHREKLVVMPLFLEDG